MVKEVIKDTVCDNGSPDLNYTNFGHNQMLFEMIKLKIRGHTIAYSTKKAKDKRDHESELEKEITKLENTLTDAYITNDKDVIKDIETELLNKKSELGVHREASVKAYILRSKTQYYEEGEKATKYFCNLEKRNSIKKVIHKLNIDGKIITDPVQILTKQREFYQNMYNKKVSGNDNLFSKFFKKENIVKLDLDDKNLCEGEITESEAKHVLKNMKNNKSPGTDGFPAEFYKFFWKDVGHYLIKSFNESFVRGELSLTQKQSIITCLPKGNKPREFLKYRRPISLLNIDYKILSGVLASRLKNILPKIISNTQKGFLKGRYIGENVRLVFDTMTELSILKKKGLLLLLDFEKAFDSLEWNYINKVLKEYNFGEGFISWFRTLYKNASSCVINNGFFSEFFNLGRGCRQGDPLSPYLFILAIEPLAMEIKQNNEIKGITIHNSTYKIGQYADDTFLLLDGSVKSLRESMSIFKQFYLLSGLKLNHEKTVAVWLGDTKNTKNSNNCFCPEINLNWSNNFTLLGINFSNDLLGMISENYKLKVQNIKNILDSYQKRKLSILGKVTVLKTFAIPKLAYLLKVLPSPSMDIFLDLEKCFKKFIWEEKRPKIIMAQLEKNIEQGGLRLPNIQALNKAAKLTWIPKLLKENGLWQELFNDSFLRNNEYIWMLDPLSLQKIETETKNLFWKDVIWAWKSYQEGIADKFDARSVPIWNTYFLQNQNLMKKRNDLKRKGLIFVNDLVMDTGEFMGYQNFMDSFQVNINFVDFYSLMHSLPRPWKGQINERKSKILGQVTHKGLQELLGMRQVCKETYWTFMDQIKPKRNYLNKWSEYFQTDITEKEMSESFKLNFQCTNESRMRSFQYKVLQRF